MEAYDAVGAFKQILALIANQNLRNINLVVSGHIHEYEVVAIFVGILQRAVINGLELHLHAGVKSLVDNLAREHVLNGGAHKSRALAWLYVLELNNGPKLAVKVQNRSILNIIGSLCHELPVSFANIAAIYAA